MKELQELIELADRICDGLDRITKLDKMICEKITCQLEGVNWEMTKMRNDLRDIGDARTAIL